MLRVVSTANASCCVARSAIAVRSSHNNLYVFHLCVRQIGTATPRCFAYCDCPVLHEVRHSAGSSAALYKAQSQYASRNAVRGTHSYPVFSTSVSQKHGRHEPRMLGNKWLLRDWLRRPQHDVLKFSGNKYLCRYV